MRYRSDIDGLRGIAIIAVLLGHAEAPYFSGGFVGVDVFFVISGFLITSFIRDEMRAGRFSFTAFYERRVRRLFPALFAVTAASLVAAGVLLLPVDLRSFSQSVVATTMFAANLLFWHTVGYFDAAADTKPLLHAWTLSVEEQFYIVFPVMLLLTVRYAGDRARLLIVAAMVVSFLASVASMQRWPVSAFYLPHLRAWELLAGAALAMGAVPALESRVLREVTAVVGAVLVGWSVATFTGATAFPGVNAVYPALGAALLVHTGASGGSGVNRLLSFGPLVFVGLVSYSLYLWHWPLLTFARYFAIRELVPIETSALVVLAFLLAVISWRFIERPFRGAGAWLTRGGIFTASGAVIAGLVTIGLVGHLATGFPQRLPADAAELAAVAGERTRYDECFAANRSSIAGARACELGRGSEAASFLVWGDSHALALAPAIDGIAGRAGRKGVLAGRYACPPLIGVNRWVRGAQICTGSEAPALAVLEQYPGIRTVVLVGRWALYTTGMRYGFEPDEPAVISRDGIGGNPRAFREGLERTLRYLVERRIDVVIVAQVPEIGWDVPSVYARARYYGREVPLAPPSSMTYRDRQKPAMDIVQELARHHPFRVFDISSALCPSEACLVEKNGRLLYRDTQHLNQEGAVVASIGLEGVF